MTEAERLDQLLDSLTDETRAALVRIFRQFPERVSVEELVRLLETGTIEQIVAAYNIKPSDFYELRDSLESAFYTGAGSDPRLRAYTGAVGFDRRHWAAEAWVRENGADKIKEVADITRAGVRASVEEAIASGQGIAKTARQIRGVGPKGRVEGGSLGLAPGQVLFVNNMRDDIAGVPRDRYFTRAARDKSYDRIVRAAQKAGKPLSAEMQEKIIRGYQKNLIARRSEAIATTETHSALNAGRYQAAVQLAEQAGMTANDLVGTWRSIADHRTRDTHVALNKKKSRNGVPFESPSGARMRYPGDRSLGAKAEETIKCRCTATWVLEFADE